MNHFKHSFTDAYGNTLNAAVMCINHATAHTSSNQTISLNITNNIDAKGASIENPDFGKHESTTNHSVNIEYSVVYWLDEQKCTAKKLPMQFKSDNPDLNNDPAAISGSNERSIFHFTSSDLTLSNDKDALIAACMVHFKKSILKLTN